MDQAAPQPAPGLPWPSHPGSRPNGEKGPSSDIKRHVESGQHQARSPSKRPHSTFAADDNPINGSISDTLVSSWLESVYPAATKRPRRNSASAIDQDIHCSVRDSIEINNSDVNRDGNDVTKDSKNYRGDTKARSEPIMPPGQDDNFVQPITPGSYQSSFQWPRGQSMDRGRSRSRGRGSSLAGSSGIVGGGGAVSPSPSRISSLIETEDYRRLNLAFNNSIIYCPATQALPANVKSLVDMVFHKQLTSDPAEAAQLDAEVALLEEDYYRPMEATVRKAFDRNVFIEPGASGNLQRADDQVMNKRAVPSKLTVGELAKLSEEIRDQHRISTPIPDILYGYSARAFSVARQKQLAETLGKFDSSNATFIRMPFLLVEFKGDGGSMWGCTNQCMGGAASCVNIGERLGRELVSRNLTPFNSTVFSIAMNGFEARLFVSWRHVPDANSRSELEPGFHFQRIRSFHLSQPDQYHHFKRHVRSILDWGTGERFEQIENALDELSATKKRRI